jgi:hypothetical protein
MDTIEECGDGSDRHLLSGSRILVGVPDNSRGCSELLSWAIGAVAKANDSVVAVHVLGKLLGSISVASSDTLISCSSCVGRSGV